MQESLYLSIDKEAAKSIVDFFSGHKLVFYKKGEIILRSDDTMANDYIFCSKKGYIVTYSISPKGHRDVRAFSRPSTIFPIGDFFVPLEADIYLPSRTVYFEALTDAYVWRAPEKEFSKLIWSSRGAQLALLKQTSLNHRLSMARLEMMQLRDVELRIVSLFLALALNFGTPKGNGSLIKAPISHQLIADSLSLARETVSREIAKLKRHGLIDYGNNCIELYDVQALKRMVENY